MRGEVEIRISSAATQGATGPMANVFGFIFGAWGETGFGGMKNQFVRRGLVHFSDPQVPPGAFRFRHLRTGSCRDVYYSPAQAPFEARDLESFQQQWRRRIKSILENRELVLKVQTVV